MRRYFADFTFGRRKLYLTVFLFVVALAFAFRIPLIRGVGTYLIKVDEPRKGDVIYVLGGAPMERGMAASRALQEDVAPIAVFTGSAMSDQLRMYGIKRTEAEQTRRAAELAGAPMDRTELLEIGTSTREEAIAVRDHALSNNYDTVIILTTEFHTRRVGRVFRKALETSGITVLVRAAPSARYDPSHWWQSEDGLIMVNNEYVKLVYYWIKY